MYRKLTHAEYDAEGRAAYLRGLTVEQMSELARLIVDDQDCNCYMLGYFVARAGATGQYAPTPSRGAAQ